MQICGLILSFFNLSFKLKRGFLIQIGLTLYYCFKVFSLLHYKLFWGWAVFSISWVPKLTNTPNYWASCFLSFSNYRWIAIRLFVFFPYRVFYLFKWIMHHIKIAKRSINLGRRLLIHDWIFCFFGYRWYRYFGFWLFLSCMKYRTKMIFPLKRREFLLFFFFWIRYFFRRRIVGCFRISLFLLFLLLLLNLCLMVNYLGDIVS